MPADVVGHPGLDPGVVAVAAPDPLALRVVVLVEVPAVDTQRCLRGQMRVVKDLALLLGHGISSLRSAAGCVILSSVPT